MSLLAMLAAFAVAAPVIADDEIIVVAPCRLTARQLHPALKAYRAGRAARAPGSILYFEADPAARREGLAVSALRVRDRGVVTPISADAAGRFLLPVPAGDDWEITGPCRDGALPISPLVVSPGTNAADRRLGDMRLQCEVGWQIARQAIAAAPGMFKPLVGGCKSSATAIYAGSFRPIAHARVSAGAVTRPVPVSADRLRYSVPLGDRRLPDDARVRFQFD